MLSVTEYKYNTVPTHGQKSDIWPFVVAIARNIILPDEEERNVYK